MGVATTPSARPKANATSGDMRPEGSGRLRVRSIRPSRSRSHHMLRALAEPTMRAVPTSDSSSRAVGTRPGARQAPAAPVSITRRVMRGLVSVTRSRTTGTPRERGRASTRISVLATEGII